MNWMIEVLLNYKFDYYLITYWIHYLFNLISISLLIDPIICWLVACFNDWDDWDAESWPSGSQFSRRIGAAREPVTCSSIKRPHSSLGIYYFIHCIYLVIMNNHSELYLEKFGKKTDETTIDFAWYLLTSVLNGFEWLFVNDCRIYC